MLALIPLLCLSLPALAAQSYSLKDEFIGDGFFSWNWETSSDPTHGRVNYVDKATAMSMNLSVAADNTFLMRADNVNKVAPGEPGRKSVRISSPAAYEDSVMVVDLWHMPSGCSTWPAWWTVSEKGPWPQGGEVDIIEGVNRNGNNLASLHTTPNCSMAPEREQRGQSVSTVCDASVNHNQGCGVSFAKPNSYGQGFNSNGGGWYAMHRASCGIYVWFWARNDSTVPIEVSQGLSTVNPDQSLWGPPDAAFPTDSCDYRSHFDSHHIVFDLTFCGDWAGSAYGTSGCPSTCEDYVNNNPSNFTEAYWELSALRVYIPDPDTIVI
ncbi:glycoside hydrolase family 16 protein [Mycena polygramma]|nr:glycoside hydrolase family 16 protein [Mycena polygramma]